MIARERSACNQWLGLRRHDGRGCASRPSALLTSAGGNRHEISGLSRSSRPTSIRLTASPLASSSTVNTLDRLAARLFLDRLDSGYLLVAQILEFLEPGVCAAPCVGYATHLSRPPLHLLHSHTVPELAVKRVLHLAALPYLLPVCRLCRQACTGLAPGRTRCSTYKQYADVLSVENGVEVLACPPISSCSNPLTIERLVVVKVRTCCVFDCL